jgi:tRNA (guanine-N7-)-methyltransferase
MTGGARRAMTTPPPSPPAADAFRPTVPEACARAFWAPLFGDEAPVEIEIGAGTGSFLLAAAARWPATNFLGIEHARSRARLLAARAARLGTPRIRTLHADARCVVTSLVPAASVAAYHVYFPDPWPKRRHARRRLFTPAFVAALARTLASGGRLLVATDVYGYARLIRARVLADERFEGLEPGDDHPGLETAFARKYRAAGRMVHAMAFARRRGEPPYPAPAAAARIKSL